MKQQPKPQCNCLGKMGILKVCVPKVQSGEHVNFPNDFSVFMPGTFTIMLSPTNTNLNYRLVTN